MSLSDPIADMMTRIRNASLARHPGTAFPGSKMKQSILGILKNEGFIADYNVKSENNKSTIEVQLKYKNKKPVISQLKRISTPGRRHYVKADDLRPVRNNIGIAIVSTSKGLMTGRKANKLKLGGEVVCQVW